MRENCDVARRRRKSASFRPYTLNGTVGLPLRRELAQQAPRQASRLAQAVLIGDALAVHPHALDPDGVRGEARLAGRQIEYPAIRAAVHGLWIEEQQVGMVARPQR